MQIKKAITEFISDEFKLDPQTLNPDTSFTADLGLTPEGLTDFLQRLQDSLNIILPEDKVPQVTTVGQLLELVSEDEIDL